MECAVSDDVMAELGISEGDTVRIFIKDPSLDGLLYEEEFIVTGAAQHPDYISRLSNDFAVLASSAFDGSVLGDACTSAFVSMAKLESGRVQLEDAKQALDFQTGQEVLRVIEKVVKEKGTTVVMITHNVEIAKMADRVVKLRSGRVSSIKRNLNPLSADEISW